MSVVSPSPEWDDTEDGYVKDDTGVFVAPVVLRRNEHAVSVRGVKSGDENAYQVEIVLSLGNYERQRELAMFEDARPAWEFANLLTRFISHMHDADSAYRELTSPSYQGEEIELPVMIEELTAEETLRQILGSNSFYVDEITEGRQENEGESA